MIDVIIFPKACLTHETMSPTLLDRLRKTNMEVQASQPEQSGGGARGGKSVSSISSIGRSQDSNAAQVSLEEYNTVLEENTNLKRKIGVYSAGPAIGKNKHRKRKKMMHPIDRMNQIQIGAYLRKTVFPVIKFLPKNWHKWKDHPMAMSMRIMSKISTPAGIPAPEYWALDARLMTNDKWGSIYANIKGGMKHQLEKSEC